MKSYALLLFSLCGLPAFAEIKAERVVDDDEPQSPNLDVSVSTSFPEADIFGVKLINGHATQARLSFRNQEPQPITVAMIAGSIVKDVGDDAHILRNLTSKRYGLEISAGAEQTLPYSFTAEMQPEDVRLQLVAVLQDSKHALYTVSAYNETVSIVEAPTSILDPQIIFLYLMLLAAFAAIVSFVYKTWITTFFPQKRRGGKGGERAKKSSGGSTKVDPTEQVAVVGADGPAVTSGAKAYDASWIPAVHLQRPETKRSRSGAPKTKVKS